jgi:hypothetical protein
MTNEQTGILVCFHSGNLRAKRNGIAFCNKLKVDFIGLPLYWIRELLVHLRNWNLMA